MQFPLYSRHDADMTNSFCVAVLCSILKILPLLVLNETFGPLVRSVIKMLDKFAGFFVVLVVFVMAFAFIFLQRFGGKVEGYDGILEASFSSFFLITSFNFIILV